MKIEEIVKENTNIKEYPLNNTSVVYFLCNFVDEIVYVGRTYNLGNRMIEHNKRFPIKSVYYIKCPKNQAVKMERKFIKKINPKYNIIHNGGKTVFCKIKQKPTMKLNIEKIKDELKKLGHTQTWLAMKIIHSDGKTGISRQLLSYMICSKKITHTERIAKALGLNPRDLIK